MVSSTKWGRTTERLTASSTVAKRCWVVLASMDELVASMSRFNTSGGSWAPAFGDRELTRKARTTRPSARVEVTSSTHSAWARSTRSLRAVRRRSASSRPSLSRADSAATTDRRSRKSISLTSARAASARSRHSASRRRGIIPSASVSRAEPSIGLVPSALAFSFWASISARTAWIPPRESCSATMRCSAGSDSIQAERWARPGRRRLGFGRSGRSSRRGPRSLRSPPRGPRSERSPRLGRSPSRPPSRPPSRFGRSDPRPPSRLGRSAPRSPSRPPRSRPPSRPRPLPRPSRSPPLRSFQVVVTPPSNDEGANSRRWASGRPLRPLGGITASMYTPSRAKSASARTTSPTLAPS